MRIWSIGRRLLVALTFVTALSAASCLKEAISVGSTERACTKRDRPPSGDYGELAEPCQAALGHAP